MADQRETEWGGMWADTMEARGCRLRKIAAGTTGEPDWRMVSSVYGIQLVEAKALLPRGRWAYSPKQLRGGQRLTMGEVASVSPDSVRVVVVGPDGFVTLTWAQALKPLERREFRRRMERYASE